MRPLRRLLAILTTLLLVVSAFGGVRAAWMCEGRVCSPDLAKCCCTSVVEIRHGECSVASAATSAGGPKASCAGECGCKAVTTGISSARSALQSAPIVVAHVFDLAPALLPRVLVLQSFVLLEAPQVRPLPPPEGAQRSVCIERASLRAPPAATS